MGEDAGNLFPYGLWSGVGTELGELIRIFNQTPLWDHRARGLVGMTLATVVHLARRIQ